MCEQLAFIASFVCGLVTVVVGLSGLFHVDLAALCPCKKRWAVNLLYFLILLVGIYGILVIFTPCPLPIHLW